MTNNCVPVPKFVPPSVFLCTCERVLRMPDRRAILLRDISSAHETTEHIWWQRLTGHVDEAATRGDAGTLMGATAVLASPGRLPGPPGAAPTVLIGRPSLLPAMVEGGRGRRGEPSTP